MRRKRAALGEALTGRVTAQHRFLLAQLLHHVDVLDEAIATCDRHIATLTAAELGVDMTRVPTAGHAASWTGLCPGVDGPQEGRESGREVVVLR